ncbi:MAG TPA: aminopeptidase P family N-terminal domain-containing protein, partial [Micavibrio sp.]
MTEKTQQSSKEKLAALRAEMTQRGLDGYLVPHTDEFQCEYTPESSNRLEWLTAFTGSSGEAVILKDKALALTDGRYAEQIKKQTDISLYEIVIAKKGTEYSEWIVNNTAPGSKIGFDPMLMTVEEFENLQKACDAKEIQLVPVPGNLVDPLWQDRPAIPASEVFLFDDAIAGRTAADNCQMVATKVAKARGRAVIINKPDSVAWLLNIRGDDVKHTPLALSYVVAHEDASVDWFIEPSRVPAHVKKHLGPQITIRHPSELKNMLETLGRESKRNKKRILLDSERAPVGFKDVLEKQGAAVIPFEDPVVRPRACKSASEMAGII